MNFAGTGRDTYGGNPSGLLPWRAADGALQ